MKKILLCVAGVGAEMRVGEFVDALFGDAAARKIKLAQRLHHPDIDREGGLKSAREQQDAVGNLRADAGKSHQFVPGGFDLRFHPAYHRYTRGHRSFVGLLRAGRCGSFRP